MIFGPSLFSMYTIPLSLMIGRYKCIKFHLYADDIQLNVHFSQKKIFSSLNDVKHWLTNGILIRLSLYSLVLKDRGMGGKYVSQLIS